MSGKTTKSEKTRPRKTQKKKSKREASPPVPGVGIVKPTRGNGSMLPMHACVFDVHLPIVPLHPQNYCSPHIDLSVSDGQAKMWRGIADAMAMQGVTLANGRRVSSSADVIRWMGEQFALHMEGRVDVED